MQSAPSPPDPANTIRAEAEANRINQYTPFGELIFTNPGQGSNASATATLTPTQDVQRLIDQQMQVSGNTLEQALTQQGQLPNTAPDFSGLPGLPGANDFGAERSRVEGAVFDRARGLLDPVYNQQEDRLTNRLANQGLPQGSEAYTSEFDTFNRGRNEAYENAALDAVLAGGQEQSRLFGQASAARSQLGQEMLAQRGVQFNELASRLGLQQVAPPSLGDFYSPGNIDVAGITNSAYQQQVAASQSQNQLLGSGLGLLGSLGSAWILSHSAFKHEPISVDDADILRGVEGLEIEKWRYRPGIADTSVHIGPYAEEFREVFGVGDGVTINTVDVFGVMLSAIKALSAKVKELENGRHPA